MRTKGKSFTCSVCGRVGKLCAREMCNTCYDLWIKSHKIRKCTRCGKVKPHHARGLCNPCYQIDKWRRNHDKMLSRRHQYDTEHREQLRSYDRKRRQKTERREYEQRHFQKYRAEHRDALRDYYKNYCLQHPTYKTHHTERRKARLANLPHDLTEEQWQEILKVHNFRCHYCGAFGVELHREHKIPVCRGGGYTADNIVPACPTCNMRKHTKTDEEFRDFLAKFPNREADG